MCWVRYTVTLRVNSRQTPASKYYYSPVIEMQMQAATESNSEALVLDQRVHLANDPRRVGTVKYLGAVQGYPGTWVGVDWDNGDAKHDGSVNGVRYFHARSQSSGSFFRTHNLSSGISFLEALHLRYRGQSTKEEEDEMYVLSASKKRVAVELLGKDKIEDKISRLEELRSASLSYMGVSNPGSPVEISSVVPNLEELDLTGNLLSKWKDVGEICKQLPTLSALNLSKNLIGGDIFGLPELKSIRILVLNYSGVDWTQVEHLQHLLPVIEELHLMGNGISTINPTKSSIVRGFDSLRLLNLEDNNIAEWSEVLKLSFLKRLEQLHLNKNKLNNIFYPDDDTKQKWHSGFDSPTRTCIPFQNLRCLLLGGNKIGDLTSVDQLNSFPKLMDIRLSENPVSDPGSSGLPRFVLIARLEKVEILNGSEISSRERKESEIRYIRLVMAKLHEKPDEIKRVHPRFAELKNFHGIEDERPSVRTDGPQKMSSALLCITLKCVGASIGEKPPLIKKLPATTTVGKLKILCESFFKLKKMKPKLFIQEEGCPLPMLLDDEMATLMDVGIGNEMTIIVDEEN
ncbi:hypothetical protein K2173_015215 [Erythroxylum novogranatense]|uniref:CAP-Gly domain-containing protein n=1 Tax=Erythroxylum novogranatense TaxID=1862640 RepID=A0AAV8T2R0_9ROSI|nr:hypothetical protein K2173_015215 [Erythroxylum novogranatense]